MSASVAPFVVEPDSSPIPGYTLIERIGVGGYGEVWKAKAPGGLAKAIKIVYGSVDDQRAARELKSLHHIKELNHPFLLSVERIEVTDEQLLVVTELADGSLRDRFDKCRASGESGIPRDELLQYMREAAEALDFLFQTHLLQHLDVKPENLLLVGNHVKVADFGLLKDLHENRQSLISGLTPKYASPEVFDGRPSRFSDQYSLAIVYQEMLTGRLPFDARTIAQLASQHVHSSPDLNLLRPQDRFAVGKALSKDHERRFKSCLAFVERLERKLTSALVLEENEGSALSDTDVFPSSPKNDEPISAAQKHDGQTIVVSAPETHTIQAPDIDFDSATYRPTVFIGIGGTGGRVLRSLKQMFADRFHNIDQASAFGLIYLDTDINAIKKAETSDDGVGLSENETLYLPIRQTKDYRDSGISDVSSISRRWIYNIPRSQRTEGLRALGRLALLDHSQRVLSTLRNLIATVTDDCNINATAESTGLEFRDYDPQVFVVASLGGGTGSGMVLDIGYAVRQILTELGLREDGVSGILSFASGRNAKGRRIAHANAYSCLNEWRYFRNPNNDYPGEPSRGFAGFREDAAAFKNSYLVDFGIDLSDDSLSAATNQIAEYLYLGSVTTAYPFVEACRQATPDPADVDQLRTFGVSRVGFNASHVSASLVESLCAGLVRSWRGGSDAALNDDRIKLSEIDRMFESPERISAIHKDVQTRCLEKIEEFGVTPNYISEHIKGLVESELKSDVESYFRKLIGELLGSGRESKQPLSSLPKLINTINVVVGEIGDSGISGDSRIEALCEVVAPKAHEASVNVGTDLKNWIINLIDCKSTRVDGARQSVVWLNGYLNALRSKVVASSNSVTESIQQFLQLWTANCQDERTLRKTKHEEVVGLGLNYASMLVENLTAQTVKDYLRNIEAQVSAASDELRDYWKDLNQLAAYFQQSNEQDAAFNNKFLGGDAEPTSRKISSEFVERKLELIKELDTEISERFFTSRHGLRDILTNGGERNEALRSKMRQLARRILISFQKEVCLSQIRDSVTQNAESPQTVLLGNAFDEASPSLLELGGARRALLMTPTELNSSKLDAAIHEIFGDTATRTNSADNDFWVACEAEQVSLESVFGLLIRRSNDCHELGSRLHTRVDVDWSLA